MPQRGSFRIARIAGVDLYLHYSWLVIAALITFSLGAHFRMTNPGWSSGTVWVSAVITGILFFAGLIAHELSHAMVARARGLGIHRITLFLLGGVAQIEKDAPTASTEFWMAIAGPAMSVAIGVLCLGLAFATGWLWGTEPASPVPAVLVWLGYINLFLAAFNLIPGFPMDGGRVLRAIVWWATGDGAKATRVAARIGQAFGWLFIAWGFWQLFTGRGVGSLWIALIGWFLLQASTTTLVSSWTQAELKGTTAGQVMSSDCAMIGRNLDVQTFVDQYLLGSRFRCYVVTEDGKPMGIITPQEIRTIPRSEWPQRTVADAMVPLNRLHVITPETPAAEALNEMASEDVNQLPVLDQGRLVGVLSRGNVLDFLRKRKELKAA